MQIRKIKADELIAGQALPWSVYSQNGKLLLDQRQVLSNEKQIERLLAIGVYREPTAAEVLKDNKRKSLLDKNSPFVLLDDLKIALAQIFKDITSDVESDYNDRIIKQTKVIQKLCYINSDAVLAAIIFDQESSYSSIHPIYCAILTELLTSRQKIPSEDRLLYIAAALTQNLGMYELQDQLSSQKEALTVYQREVIKVHPYKSMEILVAHGINHHEWLNTILYHHERPDGKGYPVGLKGNDLPTYAKTLSLIDIYSAMILPRKYRDGFFVKKALQKIFLQRGELVDEHIAQLLIKEIGVYPPGTFVKLANGDTAIVLRRGVHKANSPHVLSIISPRGGFYETPKQRDTIHKDIFGIIKVIPRPNSFKMNKDEIWGQEMSH
jgi:HD-GYP domain-containing protein (c-di-GMP phosphodiesterase class II)